MQTWCRQLWWTPQCYKRQRLTPSSFNHLRRQQEEIWPKTRYALLRTLLTSTHHVAQSVSILKTIASMTQSLTVWCTLPPRTEAWTSAIKNWLISRAPCSSNSKRWSRQWACSRPKWSELVFLSTSSALSKRGELIRSVKDERCAAWLDLRRSSRRRWSIVR